MTYVPTTGRGINTNPKTDAQWRATLANLIKSLREDKDTLVDLSELVEQLAAASVRTSEADEDIETGEVVRISSLDHIELAQADAAGNADAVGMALEDIPSGSPGRWVPLGVVEKDSWGLTPGAKYYLSASTAGGIVTTPDGTAVGNVIIEVGEAVSAEEFLFNPSQSVLL